MPPKRKVTPVEDVENMAEPKQKKATKKVSEKPTRAAKKPSKKDTEPMEDEEVKKEKKPAKEKPVKATKETKAAIKDAEPIEEEEKKAEPIKEKPTRAAKKPSKKVTEPEEDEEVKKEKKPAKEKPTRAAKRPLKKVTEPEEDEEVKKEKKSAKEKPVKAKKETKAAPKEKPAKAPPKETNNVTDTDWDKIQSTSNKKNSLGKTANLKITSWNVDGLRAWIKKGGLEILEHVQPDILCLQETKVNDDKMPEEVRDIPGYHAHWCASEKAGYAGVAILSKEKPVSVDYGIGNDEQDEDGRCITADFGKFYLVAVYVPNAGRKLVTLPKRLDWNELFKKHVLDLNKKKPVIVCGDMNVAHEEVDLANPKTNKKNAGFTQEERDGMTDFLAEGFVDVHRRLYPDEKDVYTFWTYMSKARSKNIGW